MNKYNIDTDNIIIDFSLFPFCFRCVTVGNFTNKLKDANQFFKYFKRLLENEIPTLVQFNFNNISKETKRHSHSILNDTKEYVLIKDILKELLKSYKKGNYSTEYYEKFLENNVNEYTIWQLGITGGIRLIGVRKSNVFSVLFIDYHHLIYRDDKHNQENYKLYDFCPIMD